MAIGLAEPPDDQPARELIEIVNWDDLFNRKDEDEPIIPGIAYRGRWTAIAAAAKAGKSTVILGLVVALAKTGVTVLYLDAEMGRGDILARAEDWMHLQPADLKNLHYSDLPPKLDNVEGSAKLAYTVQAINPDLVVIDGLNGVVDGAENDDTTWRDLYEWAIAPMKALNIAVLSADNMGHEAKRPRGSSVKLDKADGILTLERTDDGCKLTATHRRTSAYPAEQEYLVRFASEEGPPMTVTLTGGHGAPEGTAKIVARLDKLGAADDISVRAAARLIRESGAGVTQAVVAAAVRERKNRVSELCFGPSRNTTQTPSVPPVTSGGVYEVTPAPVTVSNGVGGPSLEEQF
jgi:KaiC/GvpD/RAD55 family RecA-like ATPase